MKLIKSLLLGSAAGLAAIAGAQAADLPVAKAAAVEYELHLPWYREIVTTHFQGIGVDAIPSGSKEEWCPRVGPIDADIIAYTFEFKGHI